MRGWCPPCETYTNEKVCWLCGSNLLYGIPERVGGGKAHEYRVETMNATIAGVAVYILEESSSLI